MEKQTNSEGFIVTARKWRPLKFDEVIGQQHITKTLKNAIASNRIHHAYLFSGPRGVGKTTTARILARVVNCAAPVDNEPCNECESCKAILDGRSLDVMEIDGASNNSVDDIRKLRENARYAPSGGKYKMYVIDEVHMLSNSAFNALLKILEEPPKHLMFVFATTEAHKVLPTIISRCQRFDFRRMEIDDIVNQLKHISEGENISIDEESLITIAKKADGSMRDGESIFDQVVAFCGRDIKYTAMAEALNLIDREFFFRVSSAVIEKNIEEMFDITEEVTSKGYDLQECMQGVLEHFRHLLTINVTGETKLIESSEAFLERYNEHAEALTKADLLRFLNMISDAEKDLRYSPQPRIRFEMTLIQLASADKAVEISELIEEIKSLKSSGNAASQFQQTSEKKISKDESAKYGKKSGSNKSAAKSGDSKSIRKSSSEETKTNTAQQQNSDIITEDIKARIEDNWDEFLRVHSESKTTFSALMEAVPEFGNKEIIFYSDSDFVAENINLNKADISDSLKEYFGTDIRIDVKVVEDLPEKDKLKNQTKENVMEDSNQASSETITKNKVNETNTSQNSVNKEDNLDDKHPVEKAVIQLFRAKEIPVDK